jgi:hypothetical protein
MQLPFPSNGGWTFFQPQTKWRNPMAMVGLEASIKAVRAHRLANPAIALKHRLSTDGDIIEQELIAFARARGALPPDPTVRTSFFRRTSNKLTNRVAGVAADIKTAARGTAVVLDWLTSGGKPVPQETANQRAQICSGCAFNVAGSWFTVAPAELIRETLEARSDLKLETPYDDKLQSCDVCKCLNRLKVFCPIEHILSRTPPDLMAEFPEWCWIKKGM